MRRVVPLSSNASHRLSTRSFDGSISEKSMTVTSLGDKNKNAQQGVLGNITNTDSTIIHSGSSCLPSKKEFSAFLTSYPCPTSPSITPSLDELDSDSDYWDVITSSDVSSNFEEYEDATETSGPGPFLLIREIHNDNENAARIVIVRDMDNGKALSEGRPMCLKILPKGKGKDDLINNELRAYKALADAKWSGSWERQDGVCAPFVMRLEAMLEEVDRVFFAMDLMECDLRDVFEEWGLVARRQYSKKWMAQITTGLAAIHAAGVIHRDLKPENIYVDFRCNVRIGDFGLSFVNNDLTIGQDIRIRRDEGYSKIFTGTWPYHAPEVLRAVLPENMAKYSGMVDYWALGLILYELEQEPLFDKPAEVWKYYHYDPLKHDGFSYFEWRRVQSKLPSEAADLIMGLIHPLPQKRYDHTMVRASPYFVNSDSSNEFDNIEQHGRDLNNIPVGQDVPVEILGYVGERDIFFPVVRAPNEGTSISYNWINPLGLWGTDSDVQV